MNKMLRTIKSGYEKGSYYIKDKCIDLKLWIKREILYMDDKLIIVMFIIALIGIFSSSYYDMNKLDNTPIEIQDDVIRDLVDRLHNEVHMEYAE